MRNNGLRRLVNFSALVIFLTLLLYLAWIASAALLPEGLLRPYFTRLFSARVGELTFSRIFLANLVPFLGLQFMNLFKVNGKPGGLYVLPIFWLLYGLILGTNSFVFAGARIPVSISILWTRTGFTELLAYTAGYEATRGWAIWEQHGLWQTRRIPGRRLRPVLADGLFWLSGLVLLILAISREV